MTVVGYDGQCWVRLLYCVLGTVFLTVPYVSQGLCTSACNKRWPRATTTQNM
jgi:hypothetical protein